MTTWGRGLRAESRTGGAQGLRAPLLASVAALGWLAAGLSACGADGGGEGAAADVAPAAPAPGSDVDPERGAPEPFGRYQFVETNEGMTIEAVGADAVQTFSCPVRSCAGLCDDCAAAACRAAGELESVCTTLVQSCSSACNCELGGMGCGFPVCAYDRQLCYVGDGAAEELPTDGPQPQGPAPDPQPEASRPESSSNGASLPVPVP